MSDLHVSDVEPADPRRPGWRRFKHAELSGDQKFLSLLAHLRELASGEPVELVFAGDCFEFDTIVATPDPAPFPVSWLERRRGLRSEEPKSVWKIRRILTHHPTLVAALRTWIDEGNRLVILVGNHDLDLHWPGVQAVIRGAVAPEHSDRLTFCEFFRISGSDTLILHGNQFDAYCVCQDPLHPFIEADGTFRIRSPFGNVAGKLMLNGMGYFNPHVESSFIRPFPAYVDFYFRYILRHQPLLAWEWLWSASVTLWVTLEEGFKPASRDPLRLEERVNDVAKRALATPAMVHALRELSVHSSVFSPIRVARELWLDRAILLTLLIALAVQVGTAMSWFGASPAWILVAFAALLPAYIGYARSCRSEVGHTEGNLEVAAAKLAQIAQVDRIVLGHTHRAGVTRIDGVTIVNTGHWSNAFDDVDCTEAVGINGFAWLTPGENGGRTLELRAFGGGRSTVLGPERGPAALFGMALGEEPPAENTLVAAAGRETLTIEDAA